MTQADRKSRPKLLKTGPQLPTSRRRNTSRIPPKQLSPKARRCRGKFRRYFRKSFYDPLYLDWERDYKWEAHQRWKASLNAQSFAELIERGQFAEIAKRAVAIESRTNLLFSFEKMALRDAIKPAFGARAFAVGLQDFLYGKADTASRFGRWCDVIGSLPRRQTRVLTWPMATVFGFIAQPNTHFFLKPMGTRRAANEYGFPFEYRPRPNSDTYEHLLTFARSVSHDLRDMRPRDMIDIQSFLWVQGSDEYPN